MANTTYFILFTLILIFTGCGNKLNTEPPLHTAVLAGNRESVKELIKNGEDVNSLNSEGATPLHWAAFKGKVEVAKILLRHNADVNALTHKGSTPLRLATTHKQKEMITLLKSWGAK